MAKAYGSLYLSASLLLTLAYCFAIPLFVNTKGLNDDFLMLTTLWFGYIDLSCHFHDVGRSVHENGTTS